MSINRKTYSGFNEDTSKNLALGAGAMFINFDPEVDTYETAKATKLLGATSGGNTFTATPSYRPVAVDGVMGAAKGLSILDSWEVTMTVRMLEFKEETYRYGLGAVTSEEVTNASGDYTAIKAKNYVTDEDYLGNLTFITTISGSDQPIMIQLYNALNMGGLSIEHTQGSDIVAELTFTGHYDSSDLDSPPFLILYPTKKDETVDPIVEG